MANINQLNSKKLLCTRFITRLNKSISQASSAPDDIPLVQAQFEHLTSKIEAFEECQMKLLALPENERMQEALLSEYDEVMTQFDRLIVTSKQPPFVKEERHPMNVSDTHDTAFQVLNQTIMNQTKLPEFNIQPFDGDLANWQSFYDLFMSSVDSMETLTPVQKLQYLKSFLLGPALAAIKDFKLTDANYTAALATLTQKYKRRRLIAMLHVEGIINTPKLDSTSYDSVNTFVSKVRGHLASLRAIDEPVEQWSKILAVLLSFKLDTNVRNRFEKRLDNDELPDVETLLTFLEEFVNSQQWQTLRSVGNSSINSTQITRKPSIPKPVRKYAAAFSTQTYTPPCIKCKEQHPLYSCPQFRKLNPLQRHQLIKSNNHCYNCLGSSHSSANCLSKGSCRLCHQRHHTLIHLDEPDGTRKDSSHQPAQPGSSRNHNVSSNSQVLITHNVRTNRSSNVSRVLLSTALIHVQDSCGKWRPIRALLDSGSQASLMSECCSVKLGLDLQPTTLSISGVSNVQVKAVSGVVTCPFRSRKSLGRYKVAALVVKNIAAYLPGQKFRPFTSKELNGVYLADPHYNEPGPIEILLGADIYFSLVKHKSIKLPEGPYAVDTALGYVISGPMKGRNRNLNSLHISVDDELSQTLRRFWELEEIPYKPVQTLEELQAERLFDEQHSRTPDGRYVVPLLFKNETVELGRSFGSANACYQSLRTRLNNNPTLCEEYMTFMQDYLESGHMTQLKYKPILREDGYFIPHHPVIKYVGPELKLRVVFNASKPSSNGVSLNDTLLPGPPLQSDLAQVVMRQRLHPIILTADIRQMFRQVLVQPNHCQYQRILWDFNLSTTPRVYRLNTVTYGTTSAPYLAIRTLRQLVKDEGETFPLAAIALTDDTFVDDIITGAQSIQGALHLKAQLVSLLAKAGMELRKWSSNSGEVLQDVPDDHKLTGHSLNLDRDHTIKILGLMWNPTSDSFRYQINLPESTISKRQLLSEAARIFDPLGWLSPITIVPKMLIQELWKRGLDWDVPLPPSVGNRWIEFKSHLPSISEVQIPRWIPTRQVTNDLLGFCDASEKGYAAVVYIRSQASDEIKISLVMAKSKVAPVKQVSLPRLELCAALLLAQLVSFVNDSLNLAVSRTFLWTDSTVALAWIQSPPHRWKTFVANRVSEINEHTQGSDWYHIRSQDNPADCASRGLWPHELPSHPLWWSGPGWLQMPTSDWPLHSITDTSTLEEPVSAEAKIVVSLVQATPEEDEVFSRFSSYPKLIRVTALCIRFSANCRPGAHRKTGVCTVDEMQHARVQLIKLVQQETFPDLLAKLTDNKSVSSSLRQLDPFLDRSRIIRVGGRIRHSERPFTHNHPCLLPSKHSFTSLMVRHYHEKYLHASPRTVQSIVERTFWIIGARNMIRSLCRKCVTCFRNRPTFQNPMMGDLPQHRVTPQKPFEVTGTDYGGPFMITPYAGRGYRCHKAYLCLFICFATKAVHLELVSDLSTQTFLQAFRRFISRRGRVSHVYSDGGTNYIGAKSHFSELQKFVASSGFNEFLINQLAEDGIQWHINPPSAPHFGGLWEAAIKSVKFHLARVIGEQVLTYEEMITVLCQIEAILNSRPLTPMSSSPDDCSVLTPSHFLTMEPGVTLPEPSVETDPQAHLIRWKRVQRVSQEFWRRWSQEYLNTLQLRSKWHKPARNLEVGQLVLIKDNFLPPLQWKLGRIIKVSPGKDNVVRVATVKTNRGELVRPVVKLAPLPIDPVQPLQ